MKTSINLLREAQAQAKGTVGRKKMTQMDAQFFSSLVDQAIGGVIALILLTKIDKRLEQLSSDVQALITEIRDELKKSA